MTPSLSGLLAAADVAKNNLLVLTAANEVAHKLAAEAAKRHADAYASVQKALGELGAARLAIDAALDADYGCAQATVESEPPETVPAAAGAVPAVSIAIDTTPAVLVAAAADQAIAGLAPLA